MLTIGDAEVYPDEGLIRRNGKETKLTPRSMDVLVYLAERQGETVSTETLLEHIWANAFIADNAVHKSISEVRHALGDDPKNPRYIRTVHKRGYRLVPPASGNPTANVRLIKKPAVVFTITAGLIFVAAALTYWQVGPPDTDARPSELSKSTPNSIAVLPLRNLSSDPNQEFLVEGIHDALIANLAKIRALHVISRTSTLGYTQTTKTSREIGMELGVENLIEGSVLRDGDHLRITINLIDASTDSHLWAESYDRELRDVLTLQTELAQAIAKEVQVQITPADAAQLQQKQPVDVQAYEAYLKGMYHAGVYQRGGAPLDALRRSIAYHEEAVMREPNWALAHAGLASAYHWLAGEPGVANSGVLWRKSKEEALRALELDEQLAQAYSSLGYVLYNYEWDWDSADRAYRRSLQLDPTQRWGYALFLLSAGRYHDAIVNFQLVEARNPNSLIVKTQLGHAHLCAGELGNASLQLRKTIELDPTFAFAHIALGYVHVAQKKFEAALADMEAAQRLSGNAVWAWPHLAYVHALMDRSVQARELLQQLERSNLEYFPEPYLALGDVDKAIAQLDAAVQNRNIRLMTLRCSPEYERLQRDSRFQNLLDQISFPE